MASDDDLLMVAPAQTYMRQDGQAAQILTFTALGWAGDQALGIAAYQQACPS